MGLSRWLLVPLMVIGSAGALLLTGGGLAAQTPSPGISGLLAGSGTEDEFSPQLLPGPGGEILKLWQRRLDARAGGGSAILARASGPDGWQTLIDIRSPEKGVTVRDPDLAMSSAGDLAVVYRWWRDQPRAKHLRLARSDDGGKTWAMPDQSIDTAGKAFDPGIAWADRRTVFVVWADERRANRAWDVYGRRSIDGGASWEPEQLISRFPETLLGDIHARPQILGDGQGRLWVVWVGVKNGRSSLYLNRSVDAGRTWTASEALTGESQSVYRHNLLRNGDRLLLVWHDRRTGQDRIYAVGSSDAGVTWSSPARVDHLADSANLATAAASAVLGPDGEALVAWHDPRNGRDDVFIARSTDGGRTWGAEDRRMDMDEVGTAMSRYPRLARAGDGRLALAWEDDRDGFEAVYVRVRSAGPTPEWGSEIRVAPPGPKRAMRLPRIHWGPDERLYVAWEVWDHQLAPNVSKRVGGTVLRVDRP